MKTSKYKYVEGIEDDEDEQYDAIGQGLDDLRAARGDDAVRRVQSMDLPGAEDSPESYRAMNDAIKREYRSQPVDDIGRAATRTYAQAIVPRDAFARLDNPRMPTQADVMSQVEGRQMEYARPPATRPPRDAYDEFGAYTQSLLERARAARGSRGRIGG